VQRRRRLRRNPSEAARVDTALAADRSRLDALEARVQQLEGSLEALQDALYRQAVAHDKALAELHECTKPEHIARALSEDARKRGL
jgi:septal ring factor EnvC (AmiA/AmiB activator)